MSKVITKLINGNVRKLFRNIEKKSIKLIVTKSHRAFNECCLNNNLLPNYTNIYYIYLLGQAVLYFLPIQAIIIYMFAQLGTWIVHHPTPIQYCLLKRSNYRDDINGNIQILFVYSFAIIFGGQWFLLIIILIFPWQFFITRVGYETKGVGCKLNRVWRLEGNVRS